METTTLEAEVQEQLIIVKEAARKLVRIDDQTIRAILYKVADRTSEAHPMLLAANQKDLDRMDPSNPKYDRLLLDDKRLSAIEADIRAVADLPSPLGRVLDDKVVDNGLHMRKISVPMGVIGIVFESRPNVTFDVFTLCLKSGNAAVLKGSRDAHYSNLAIVALIKKVLADYDLADVVYLAPSEREVLGTILQAINAIDVIIPRGSQGLIDFVRDNAKVPVIETGAGIVHTYFDKSGDLEMGRRIIENAKTRRVSVCNALDTLLIHEDRLSDLPALMHDLDQKYALEVYVDDRAYRQLSGTYSDALLHKATETDFGIEFLSMKMSIKTVTDLDDALDYIAAHGSKHSEAIIAKDPAAIQSFFVNVDAAAVYSNTSTAYTDGGQFGLGAEIGISTQKLHARGPMGLNEITSYKWIVTGNGQIRP